MMKSFVWKGYRWRAIWSGLFYRPLAETFHDFLIGLMRGTFGKDWTDTQDALVPEKRHVVARWLDAFKNLPNSPLRLEKGVYVPSGPIRATLGLAYDLYFLQLVNKLPV